MSHYYFGNLVWVRVKLNTGYSGIIPGLFAFLTFWAINNVSVMKQHFWRTNKIYWLRGQLRSKTYPLPDGDTVPEL